jgi:tetratricopeptide (TPR) repeat protein
MSQRFNTIVLLASMLVFGCAMAATEDLPSQPEIVSLLSNRKYSELDRRLSLVQQAYARGAINDEHLREVFRDFYFTTPSLAPNFDEWIAQFPRSYVAHLARGVYYKKIGQERRGGQAASETSREQFQEMERALAKASADLEQSVSLDPKPLLTYMHQLTIDQLLGRDTEKRAVLDRSIAVDKNNYVVRYAYMGALQTRWGGSLEQMQDFMRECRGAHLSATQLGSLQALIAEDEAWNYRYIDGNTVEAVHAYKRAARLNPRESCTPCGPFEQAADTLREDHKYPEAIKLYSKVLQHDPRAVDALSNRAYSEIQVGLRKEAFMDFSRAAELGSPYAQDMLGRIYLVGASVPHDRQKAIEWLTKAVAQGYEPSRELLEMAKHENVQILPQPGDPPL